ncbi:MAG: hypothetical protein KJZ64_07890 [Sphingomonadaceae bacterium]|nr:hypothetical protein [Sphingomonadaceae bacterium]
MKIRTMLAATAALSMAATPVLANAAPAIERAAAPVAGESDFGGEQSGEAIILAILAIAAIIAGIVVAAGSGNDDNPISA